MASQGGILKILDAYVAVGGDTSGLDSAVDQSVAKAAAAGGKIESALSPRKVLGALGAAAGLAFGVMVSGANQLDAAMRQLQADTGMTDTEAKAAEHSLAAMYKTNLQGFDEIGATMAVVHNELGLVGAAADAVTERFLRYATATGQGAAPAASDFAAILKAFNVDASQTPAIMDKLIASHQVYGTVVTEDQAALAKMGPAMVAANMSIDDGIALLNAFKVAGVDVAKAPMALASAVKQLKPGQNLNDLIAQIAAIPDPTMRAQRAMEIFGGKSVGWAKVFKDAGVVLSDFSTTEEQNAGATTKAADAIEEGFGKKFQLIMKNAEGTLAEFGTNFGDIIGIAQLFGPGLTRAIAMGLGALAGMIAGGTAQGAAAAAASTAAQAAGVAAGQAVVAAGATPAAAAAGAEIGTAMGGAAGATAGAEMVASTATGIAAAGGGAIAMSLGALLAGLALPVVMFDVIPRLFDWSHGTGNESAAGKALGLDQASTQTAVSAGLGNLLARAANDAASGPATRDNGREIGIALGEGMGEALHDSRAPAQGIAAIAAGIKAGTPRVAVVVAEMLKTLSGTGMAAVNSAWWGNGADAMAELAAGITSARKKPLDAFDLLKQLLKDAMTPQQEQLRLHGELLSKTLAKGLKSGDPAVRAQAIATVKLIADRLGQLAQAGGKAGKESLIALRDGMKSKDPAVRDASTTAYNAAMSALNPLPAAAGAVGAAAGQSLADQLKAKVAAALAGVLADIAALPGKYSSAPGSPVHDSRAPGTATPTAAPAAPAVPHQVVPLFALGTPFVPADMLAIVHKSEIIVPAAESDAIRAGRATLGSGGTGRGGNIINVGPIYNPKPEPASTSTRRELRKLSLSGSVI